MGALILVWFVYLFNVLSMAVRVHKLDPVDVRNETIHSAGRDLANLRQVAAAAASSRNAGVAVSAPKQEEPKEKATNSSFSLPNNLGGLPLDYQEIILEQQRAAADAAVGIKPKPRRPGWQPNPFGHMVEPEDFLGVSQKRPANVSLSRPPPPPHQILKAYLEPIDKSTWNLQPLPVRQVTANDLTLVEYPKLNSCQRLPEQWPVDDYPDEDPFLPWIHDVFPTHDGKFLQFVAQNKRRCHTGTTPDEEAILEQMAPQVALFQHVPIQKLANLSTPESPRYRLTSHEQADPESVSTRFICRFKPSGEINFFLI